MGHFHLSVHGISRRGGTVEGASAHRSGASRSRSQNAISASVYRNGQSLKDEQTGTWHQGDRSTYGLRIVGSSMMFPTCTPDCLRSRHALWNEVERKDTRVNSQLARDYDIALPFGWPQRLRERVVRQFVREQFLSRNVAAEVSFHKFGSSYAPETKAWKKRAADHAAKGTPYYELANEPKDALAPYVLTIRRRDGSVKEYYEFQPHVHVMVPTRFMTKDGLGAKVRGPKGMNGLQWDSEQHRSLRLAWATIANMHLPEDQQISPLSYREQGIAREPQINMGMAATKLERLGRETEQGAKVVRIKFRNDLREMKAATMQPEAKRMEQTPEEYVRDNAKAQAKAFDDLRQKSRESIELRLDKINREAAELLGRAKAERLEREAAATKAQREQEAQREELDRQRRRGAIADPHLRQAIAVGETAGGPGNWIDQAMAAHGLASAMFLRDQDEYRRQLASPLIGPEAKAEISLRQRIEYLEYRAVTTEDLVRTYKVIGGRNHLQRADEMQDRVFEARMQAASLREKHGEMLRRREEDVRRSQPHQGPERRESREAFERRHADNMHYIGKVARPEQMKALEANHLRERSYRDDFETGRQQDRRMPVQQETGRQKENRQEREAPGVARDRTERAKPDRERSDARQASRYDEIEAAYAAHEAKPKVRDRGRGR